MAIMEKLKDFMGIPQDEAPEEGEDIPNVVKESADDRPISRSSSFSGGNKVVNIHTTTQLQVVLVKPERFEDVGPIADQLNDKKTVVLNLETANKDLIRRVVDFLSGVAYANKGQIKKIANSTYIITPCNVNIMGDLVDELENNGIYL